MEVKQATQSRGYAGRDKKARKLCIQVQDKSRLLLKRTTNLSFPFFL